jgi:hypothetical protein
MKDKKKEAIEANNDSSNKRKKLKKLITKLKKKVDKMTNEDDEGLTELTTLLKDIFKNLKNIYKINSADNEENMKIGVPADASNQQPIKDADAIEVSNVIKINQDIETFLSELEVLLKNNSSEDIETKIKELINLLTSNITNKINNMSETPTDSNKDEPILLANFVINFLKILVESESQNNNDEKEENKFSIDNLEKLIKIFKKYLYICENNIKKYERIFDYNEIGSIDEAFMIESYSKFLKKLHKLKQNLESKDTEKIKRELINSLDQFFNLHGFNKPENIETPDDIKYIVQRILNYT